MTIVFPCESCGHRFEVDGSLAGRKSKCKKCGHIFIIPVPRESTRPAPATQKTYGASTPPPASKPRPARPPQPAPNPYDDLGADDPYGLDDPPLMPERQAPAPQEDEEFLPSRARVGGPSKKKKSRGSEYAWYELLPWYIFKFGGIALLALIPLAAIFPSIFGMLLLVDAIFLGVSLSLIGGIGMLGTCFQESIVCGLLYIFLNPIYPTYYLITRWDAMKRWFGYSLVGMMIFIGFGLTLPAIAAARNAAQVARMRQQGLAGNAQPADGSFEQVMVAHIELIESLGNMLAGVRDVGSAAKVGPEYQQLRDKLLQDDPKVQAMNAAAGIIERATVDAKYTARAEQAAAKYKAELARLQANPTVWNALMNGPPADDQGLLARAPGGPPRRGPGGQDAPNLPGTPGAFDPSAAAPNLPGAPGPNVPGAPRRGNNNPGRAFAGNGFGGQEAEDPDVLKQVLNDLRIPDRQHRNKALERLLHTPVDAERREEIAKQVALVLQDPDQRVHTQAAKVLAYWGGKENTPAILAALRGSNVFFRSALLDAIAAIKDPAAAEDVALALPDDKERAARALIAMGSEAEPAVIKLLVHPNVFVRTEACKILRFIGTKASIRPLEDVYRRANGFGFDADAAKAAAQAIGIPSTPSKRPRRN